MAGKSVFREAKNKMEKDLTAQLHKIIKEFQTATGAIVTDVNIPIILINSIGQHDPIDVALGQIEIRTA